MDIKMNTNKEWRRKILNRDQRLKVENGKVYSVVIIYN